MRPLIIANIEKLEASDLFTARLFDEDGQLLDEIIKPYADDQATRADLVELMLRYGYNTAELWTSTPRLYKLGLGSVGLATTYKHRSDTEETERAVQTRADLLRQVYEITPQEEPTQLPKWRAYLINVLTNLIKKLGGNTHD